MLRTLTGREKKILSLTIASVILAVSARFLFLPLLNQNDTLNKRILLTGMKLAKNKWLLEQKDTIESAYGRFFPLGQHKGDTDKSSLALLERVAKSAGVRIVDIRSQGLAKDAKEYVQGNFDVKTEGPLAEQVKFIYEIENSFSLLSIKRLQLHANLNTGLLEGAYTISQITFKD